MCIAMGLFTLRSRSCAVNKPEVFSRPPVTGRELTVAVLLLQLSCDISDALELDVIDTDRRVRRWTPPRRTVATAIRSAVCVMPTDEDSDDASQAAAAASASVVLPPSMTKSVSYMSSTSSSSYSTSNAGYLLGLCINIVIKFL